MSVSNLVHPRNIYRVKPDYNELAAKYPEFLEVASIVSNKMIVLSRSR
jgi:hypothetical protein